MLNQGLFKEAQSHYHMVVKCALSFCVLKKKGLGRGITSRFHSSLVIPLLSSYRIDYVQIIVILTSIPIARRV